MAAWEGERVRAWLAVKDEALALAGDAHRAARGGPAESRRAQVMAGRRVMNIIRKLDESERREERHG